MSCHVFRFAIMHRQSVQVATVIGFEFADKRRSPARHKAEVVIQRTQRREQRVDDPQAFAAPRHFVAVNVAGPKRVPRQIRGIVSACGSNQWSNIFRTPQDMNVSSRSHCYRIGTNCDPHRLFKIVKRKVQLITFDSDDGQLAGYDEMTVTVNPDSALANGLARRTTRTTGRC